MLLLLFDARWYIIFVPFLQAYYTKLLFDSPQFKPVWFSNVSVVPDYPQKPITKKILRLKAAFDIHVSMKVQSIFKKKTTRTSR